MGEKKDPRKCEGLSLCLLYQATGHAIVTVQVPVYSCAPAESVGLE